MNTRTIDYIVSSLPTLDFNRPAPMSWEKFRALCGEELISPPQKWVDLETQLKNVIAIERNGERYVRPAVGCSIFWRNKISSCFQEKDPLKRENLIDKVWWDAAGELIDVTSPLGKGALAAYGIRLKIAIKRDKISQQEGNNAFNRLTAETKIEKFDL